MSFELLYSASSFSVCVLYTSASAHHMASLVNRNHACMHAYIHTCALQLKDKPQLTYIHTYIHAHDIHTYMHIIYTHTYIHAHCSWKANHSLTRFASSGSCLSVRTICIYVHMRIMYDLHVFACVLIYNLHLCACVVCTFALTYNLHLCACVVCTFALLYNLHPCACVVCAFALLYSLHLCACVVCTFARSCSGTLMESAAVFELEMSVCLSLTAKLNSCIQNASCGFNASRLSYFSSLSVCLSFCLSVCLSGPPPTANTCIQNASHSWNASLLYFFISLSVYLPLSDRVWVWVSVWIWGWVWVSVWVWVWVWV
jgi:hypothetical protein